MLGFAFGMINAEEAHGKEDRQMQPASRCCFIKICHASLYFRSDGYDLDLIVFSTSLMCISATTSQGSLFACGISSKISLYSFFNFFSHAFSCSCTTNISRRSQTAPATLNSLTSSGFNLAFFSLS